MFVKSAKWRFLNEKSSGLVRPQNKRQTWWAF